MIPKSFASSQNQKTLLASMEKLEKSASEMSAYTQTLYNLSQIDDPVIKYQIQDKALQGVKGTIRKMLGINYTVSGVDVKTGKLKQATVDNAVISFNQTRKGNAGIYIHMAPNMPNSVYAAACVFRYGAIRGAAVAVIGEANRVGAYSKLGRGGEKQRRRIKKLAEKSGLMGTTSGGVTYIPPKRPFFDLTDGQKSIIAQMFQDQFIAVANQWMKKQVRGIRVNG